MIIFFLFIFGLIVGSFLNVLIDRLPQDKSIVFPPSHCVHCRKRLAWYDLIPVLSFLILDGRCRYCHSPISIYYPIVELITGVLFVVVLVNTGGWGSWMEVLYQLFIISSFIVIFFADLKYGIIPDKIIFPAVIVAFFFEFILHNSYFIIHILSALASFLFFLAIYLFTKGRGMGFGDVKLALLLGLVFGFPKIVFVLYIAFLTGAAFSIILIVLRRKKLKETVAFGPFLVLGALFVFFFWNYIDSIWQLPVGLP